MQGSVNRIYLDTNLASANTTFLAVNLEGFDVLVLRSVGGGGAFACLPLSMTGKAENTGVFNGHQGSSGN